MGVSHQPPMLIPTLYLNEFSTNIHAYCTARQCCLIRQIYGVLYSKASYLVFYETSSYWSAKKKSQLFICQIKKSVVFSAFDWPPLHTVWVVHLPKLTGMGFLTVSIGLISVSCYFPHFPHFLVQKFVLLRTH